MLQTWAPNDHKAPAAMTPTWRSEMLTMKMRRKMTPNLFFLAKRAKVLNHSPGLFF
jgi:hypothetical protein